MQKDKPSNPSWQELLNRAVTEPGSLNKAYSNFWRYSVGNQMLALIQCYSRHIQPGPIASFNGWHELGRHVKKGEKALVLCMPITRKRKEKDETTGEEQDAFFKQYIWRPNWFVLSQTDGAEYKPEPIPDWNKQSALDILEIREIPFDSMNGNAQGYARPGRELAINPLAGLPHKTLFHEIAHIMLGHCDETPQTDHQETPRSLQEVEAEAVALICCESLGLPGNDSCRAYIQSWLGNSQIPEKSAQKIFHAADMILRAGRIQMKNN